MLVLELRQAINNFFIHQETYSPTKFKDYENYVDN